MIVHLTIIAALTTLTSSEIAFRITASDIPDYSHHACNRACSKSPTPMRCEYALIAENYFSMTTHCKDCLRNHTADCFNTGCCIADGREHYIKTFNRQLPGPKLIMCLGDEVVINVTNTLYKRIFSVHFHGMAMNGTNHMDGVNSVTQYNILPHSCFSYQFVAGQTGTYFYHAHTSMLMADGLSGAFIVKSREPEQARYDFDLSEHIVFIQDWWKQSEEEITARKEKLGYKYSENDMSAILIDRFGATLDNHVPPAHFRVDFGYVYRFRLINAATSDCRIKLMIEEHNMTVIELDGNAIKPLIVDSMSIANGERIDILLNATQPPSSYWIKLSGAGTCLNKNGMALLDYTTPDHSIARNKSDAFLIREITTNYSMNCLYTQPTKACINYDQIESLNRIDARLLRPHADVVEYLTLGDKPTQNINGIHYTLPHIPMIYNPRTDHYCNECHRANGSLCICPHVRELPTNQVIELIILGSPIFPHPMHLHGFSFAVIGFMEDVNATNRDEIQDLDAKGLLKRTYINHAMKDVILVPGGGYVIVRFISDSLGYWMFHCHVGLHYTFGMALVFKIGGTTQITRRETDLPQCRSVLPS